MCKPTCCSPGREERSGTSPPGPGWPLGAAGAARTRFEFTARCHLRWAGAAGREPRAPQRFCCGFQPRGGQRGPGASPGRWHCRAAQPGMLRPAPLPARSDIPGACPGIKFISIEEPPLGHLFRTVMIL